METSTDLKQELGIALFRFETALSQAILSHYCKSMATITGKSEDEIRSEIMEEKEQLIKSRQQDLPRE